MEDISPKLLKTIKSTYLKEIRNNKEIKIIIEKTHDNEARYGDSFNYSRILGKCLEKAFKDNISDIF